MNAIQPHLILACLLAACSSPRPDEGVWRNSLGMAFRPVPTPRGQLAFAVVETQRGPMQQFRGAAGYINDSNFGRMPCDEVSWHEAESFCQWLTHRERALGVISAHQRYRLPTDHEWSCAVGLGDLENASSGPEEKSNQIAGLYPWGSQWPPPKGAGNLCGRESAGHFGDNHIADFRDALPPGELKAGASHPNELGLFDLGGSLWEWCSDRFRDNRDWRVLRGGSWKSSQPATLLSSHRTHDPPDYRSDSVGFRCVLEGASLPCSAQKDSLH